MKSLIKPESTGWVAAAVVVLGLGALSGVAANGATKVETWRFDSDALPAHPEFVSNVPAGAEATVNAGAFASGWMATNPIFGPATGVWDLGRAGTIACSGLAGLVGGSGQEKNFTVKVTQYNDGGIYYDLATVTVAGATLVGSSVTSASAGLIGDWLTQETHWQASSGAVVDAVQIAGAYYGSLVDQVSIETAAIIAPPPLLTIRQVGAANNQVEVSWPAGYSGMVLESSSDVNDPQGWSAVGTAVQTDAGISSVTVEATGTSRFYRLKTP